MTDKIEVPFSDDQSEEVRDDDSAADDAKATPAERQERKEARRQRAAERERERKEQAEELRALRESSAKTAQELAELRGYVAAKTSPQASDGKDEFERRLDAVYDKQREAYNALQAEQTAAAKTGLTPERQRHYEKIARDIEAEKGAIIAERAVAQRAPALEQSQARQAWVQKHPDIYGEPTGKALRFAHATYERRKAMGEADTHALVDECMEEARVAFKLGGKKPPAAIDRARLSGIPSSGGGGDSSGGGVIMTKELRQMATSLYSDLPESEALKKWASTVGKSLRAKKIL